MQSDDDAKEHCNQRFMEMVKSIPQIRDMLPQDRHLVQIAALYFGALPYRARDLAEWLTRHGKTAHIVGGALALYGAWLCILPTIFY